MIKKLLCLLGFLSPESAPTRSVVRISGCRMNSTLCASIRPPGNAPHLYFLKDGTWSENGSNGHWTSLIALLIALHKDGHEEVIIEPLYIHQHYEHSEQSIGKSSLLFP